MATVPPASFILVEYPSKSSKRRFKNMLRLHGPAQNTSSPRASLNILAKTFSPKLSKTTEPSLESSANSAETFSPSGNPIYYPTQFTLTRINSRELSETARNIVLSLLQSPSTSKDVVTGRMLLKSLQRKCDYRRYKGQTWGNVFLKDRQYAVHILTTIMNVNSSLWHLLSCFLTSEETATALKNACENTQRKYIQRTEPSN